MEVVAILISRCCSAPLKLQADYFECTDCLMACRGKMIRDAGSAYARGILSDKEKKKRKLAIAAAKQRTD